VYFNRRVVYRDTSLLLDHRDRDTIEGVASEFWKNTVPLMRLLVVSEAIPLNTTLAPVLGFGPMPTAIECLSRPERG